MSTALIVVVIVESLIISGAVAYYIYSRYGSSFSSDEGLYSADEAARAVLAGQDLPPPGQAPRYAPQQAYAPAPQQAYAPQQPAARYAPQQYYGR